VLLAALAAFVPGSVLAATEVISTHVLLLVAPIVAGLAVALTFAARAFLRRHLADLRTVLVDRRRAAALWLGAIATPLFHVLALYAVTRAIGVHITPAVVGAVYLTVSTLSALVPAPGALGAFDVLLVGGLTAVGMPATAAVASTLAYRLVTVWLPLVPAGCLLAVLVRRNVI
jgi:uncharacterized protein (TIRG00374 family)